MKISRFLVAAAAALLSLPAVAAPTAWTIDTAHSTAGFTVKHLAVSKVHGELGPVTGTVNFDKADPSKSTVEASIDVTNLSTQNEKRDGHLKSPDFFDAAKFPTATFKSTSVTKAGEGHWTVVGNLTLHGVTKPVTLDVEGPAAEQPHPMMKGTTVSAFSATGKINRKDFSVGTGNFAGDAIVSDEVQIQLDVEVNRKG